MVLLLEFNGVWVARDRYHSQAPGDLVRPVVTAILFESKDLYHLKKTVVVFVVAFCPLYITWLICCCCCCCCCYVVVVVVVVVGFM